MIRCAAALAAAALAAAALAAAALAVVALLAPAASASGDCRTDGLGTTICRNLPPQVDELRPRSRDALTPDVGRDLEPLRRIPSTRRDAFGIVRPDRRGLSEGVGLGESPRPEGAPLRCRPDSFGNLRCR
jgi:hypothetical protein